MSNYHLAPADKPQALTPQALRSLRQDPVQGISRRTLLRRSIGGVVLLWLTEVTVGSIGFLWPNRKGGFGGTIEIGTIDDVKATNASIPFKDGFPAYVQDARAFIMLIDTGRQEFVTGIDEKGDGTVLNVRGLYQRCPHLGCKPNPCLKNFWIECPCHGSRYDRLGIKAAGDQYGPAPRSMDRFSAEVDAEGVLFLDTSRQEFTPGEDKTGDGTALNVRALYQRCPHLGCKPNPCLKNYWFECPCHGSRYDRLGIKALGPQYGPAPRSMDRFSITVSADGKLTIDTSKITLGPLPVAVGQPGIIPPKSPVGCI